MFACDLGTDELIFIRFSAYYNMNIKTSHKNVLGWKAWLLAPTEQELLCQAGNIETVLQGCSECDSLLRQKQMWIMDEEEPVWKLLSSK
jgi:hypothetical protein